MEGGTMNPTALLRDAGQSIWLDNITRDLLDDGTLGKYIDQFSVTGLTSNPTIFEHAIRDSDAYDSDILSAFRAGRARESAFFDLAIKDITRAADLFRMVHEETSGVDGWVSLEVSPTLAHDVQGTITAAKELHARVDRPNVYIKIPGTAEGIQAIEESIFAGVPINVTLLFSTDQYLKAANAYVRGIERRIADRLSPDISSVASIFISRWDVAIKDMVSQELRNQLGVTIAHDAYRAYQDLLLSPRWQRIYNFGARPQRLLWASTGTKDSKFSDTFYVDALTAPFTVNTMPDATLKAFADHGTLSKQMERNETRTEELLRQFMAAGIDPNNLGHQLQEDGASSFVKSWDQLMHVIDTKSASLQSHR
jgi:transaldolase